MARARNIKPAFFQNEHLAECDPLARLLFAGLWTLADRLGKLEDRPKRIKAATLPYDECDADALLLQLAERGFIQRYCVGASRYILIVNFTKHQHPHAKEPESAIPSAAAAQTVADQAAPGTSTIQEPVEHQASMMQAEKIPEQARLIPSYLIPSYLISDSPLPIPDSPSSTGTAEGCAPPSAPKAKAEPQTSQTWKAYGHAYLLRYGVEPVRNATTSGQLAKFVKRIGVDEAPHVAAFFVQHNAQFYVKKMHSVGLLLADAEKLRTEWATNRRVTDTEARQADKTQALGSAFQELIEEARHAS